MHLYEKYVSINIFIETSLLYLLEKVTCVNIRLLHFQEIVRICRYLIYVYIIQVNTLKREHPYICWVSEKLDIFLLFSSADRAETIWKLHDEIVDE